MNHFKLVGIVLLFGWLTVAAPVGASAVLAAGERTAATRTVDYVPGVRRPIANGVTITKIEPDRILYAENDQATVKVTVKNAADSAVSGTLVALLHVDLDAVREVGRTPFSLGPGAANTWSFTCNVGPETYGRAIEVRFLDPAGKLLDRWEEYFQVAAEWLRVQMHTDGRYRNMSHYFASEPNDFGVHPTDAEEYLAGQSGYHVIPAHLKNERAAYRQRGRRFTFYQCQAFCGIMGYEEMRQHPECALYDANGQFAVDPIYGGYPNPMEMASPVEIGPKRTPKKPYLNKQYTPWQHCVANFADPEVIAYGCTLMREYARAMGFDGVYLDAVPVAFKGYRHDGTLTIPDDSKEAARINARTAETFLRILKQENPLFGVWCNFSYYYLEYARSNDARAILGSGILGDVNDQWIRAITAMPNTSFLMELQGTLMGVDSPDTRPAGLLDILLKNRDYIVQTYGANAIVGYIGIPFDEKTPGPGRWAWATLNYFNALFPATQHHLVMTCCVPSNQPEQQFQTRFSRFFWASDVKVVPEKEVDRLCLVKTPEPIWWKNFVYRRATENGYDLIVHLVRIPPTKRWDVKWVDEPAPLEGVELTADTGRGVVTTAYACRPHHFEDPQQVIQRSLKPTGELGKTTVTIPPFRYHTMVILRVNTTKS